MHTRPSLYGLLCDFCSSVREFARQHFFPADIRLPSIPPHDGHPCLRLTLPTAERVVVFHHLVVAHAGRTQNGSRNSPVPATVPLFTYPMISSRTTSSTLPRIISILRTHPCHLLVSLHPLIHTFRLSHLPSKHRNPLFALLLHGFQQRR